MSAGITLPDVALRDFCQRSRIIELALFGSALREDFGPHSDIDLLVRFAPEATPTLFDLTRMQDELSEILGRPVDLVSRRAIEASHNPIRRNAILDSAKIIYAA